MTLFSVQPSESPNALKSPLKLEPSALLAHAIFWLSRLRSRAINDLKSKSHIMLHPLYIRMPLYKGLPMRRSLYTGVPEDERSSTSWSRCFSHQIPQNYRFASSLRLANLHLCESWSWVQTKDGVASTSRGCAA